MNNGTYDLQKVRNDFPMYRDRKSGFAFLDTAASSLTPQPVIDMMDAFYKECRSNVHRGMYAASIDATDRYEAARAKIAAFINSSVDEVVFTDGATEALNMAAYSLCQSLGKGDEVVISVMEHHANLVPWQQLGKRLGFTLTFIPLGKDGCSLDMDAAKALITPATKVVAVSAASNVLGVVTPARELADLAHSVGAVFVLDASQIAGHGNLDVKASDCDLMAFSAHKMYGPTGIGVLYGKRAVLDRMPPFMFGGDMIVEVTKEDAVWNDVPYKFEPGTPNIAGAIGLGAAIDWINGIGLDAIRAHEASLVRSCITRIEEIPGMKVHGPCAGAHRGAVVSMTMDGVHPHDLTDILGREGVAVRGGHHCAMPLIMELNLPGGTVRASFGAYSGEDDIDLLIAALKKARAIFTRS
jgi:cysteine desulfurase/selenocysteine lyase